jgi:hypothetical protein
VNALRLPVETFARSPELAPLAILENVLLACEASLFAAHIELAHGALDHSSRASSPMRAHVILVAARRLGTAIASYREALAKENRQTKKLCQYELF